MELNEAMNAFAVRLYRWCVNDFIRELLADCPLLSMIGQHHRRIGAFVLWDRTLCDTDRERLARAMTLMYHNNARNIMEEPITEEMERWGEECYEQTSILMEKLPPLLSADRSSPAFQSPNTSLVLSALSSTLSPAFGQVELKHTMVSCRRTLQDWQIKTDFGYAERENNLMFEYQFIRQDGAPIIEAGYGPFPRNLLAFYGLWPHTVVGIPSLTDCEPMAKAMVKLAEHFISEAEPLFDGLGIND